MHRKYIPNTSRALPIWILRLAHSCFTGAQFSTCFLLSISTTLQAVHCAVAISCRDNWLCRIPGSQLVPRKTLLRRYMQWRLVKQLSCVVPRCSCTCSLSTICSSQARSSSAVALSSMPSQVGQPAAVFLCKLFRRHSKALLYISLIIVSPRLAGSRINTEHCAHG